MPSTLNSHEPATGAPLWEGHGFGSVDLSDQSIGNAHVADVMVLMLCRTKEFEDNVSERVHCILESHLP